MNERLKVIFYRLTSSSSNTKYVLVLLVTLSHNKWTFLFIVCFDKMKQTIRKHKFLTKDPNIDFGVISKHFYSIIVDDCEGFHVYP